MHVWICFKQPGVQRWELTWAEVLSTVFHPSLNYFHLLCLYIHEWRGCPNYTFLLPLAWFIAFHHPILPSINMVPMISMPRDVQYMFVKKRSLVLDQYLVWADLSWGIGMELFHDLSWKEKHRWNKFRSLWAIKCPSKPWQRANLLRYQTPGFSSPEWLPITPVIFLLWQARRFAEKKVHQRRKVGISSSPIWTT